MATEILSYFLYPLVERQQQRQILPKLTIMHKFARLSLEEREQANRQHLCETVMRAAQEVPYYRDLFRTLGFEPEKLRDDSRYLKDLPYLTKEIVREQGDLLLSDKVDKSSLHLRKTGGSTGPSTLIYYSQEALDWTSAANLLVLEWSGKRRYTKEVHLSSEFPEPLPRREQLRETIKCLALNRVNITTDSFDPDALNAILEKLRQAKPYSIQGHPSTLYALAIHAKTHAVPWATNLFRVFESTGEVLDDRQRQIVSEVFNCDVYNRYGNAEFGVVAHTEHPQSANLKILDYLIWPETRETEDGLQEIVLTGLMNPAMPLIRYRTGDLGALIQVDGEFHITNIIGRVHDLVAIGDRRYPTHYIQDLLDRLGGIDEFQLEQITPQRCLLRLVPRAGVDAASIAQRVQAWWGDNVEIEIVSFEALKRVGWRSKFRHLVNMSTPEDASTETSTA
ncbi:MAG: CoF synthetase [Leptolyngbya sp.]|nr:MAG: CoF synthetase [Leptolyngbya sp.]